MVNGELDTGQCLAVGNRQTLPSQDRRRTLADRAAEQSQSRGLDGPELGRIAVSEWAETWLASHSLTVTLMPLRSAWAIPLRTG